MVQSVELVLDVETDAHVRGQWSALEVAGIRRPQLAPSNRPHVTMVVFGRPRSDHDGGRGPSPPEDAEVEDRIARALGDLPVDVRLGALTCFGRGRFILVRTVVPTVALLELQARLAAAVADRVVAEHQMAPGRWTAHVTLARRLSAEQVATALIVLDGSDDRPGQAVQVRRWDSDAKREWVVAG